MAFQYIKSWENLLIHKTACTYILWYWARHSRHLTCLSMRTGNKEAAWELSLTKTGNNSVQHWVSIYASYKASATGSCFYLLHMRSEMPAVIIMDSGTLLHKSKRLSHIICTPPLQLRALLPSCSPHLTTTISSFHLLKINFISITILKKLLFAEGSNQ